MGKCGHLSARAKKGIKYNARQLKIGCKVELEHTCSRAQAKRIAKDHLTEFNGVPYYTYLLKMERKLKKLARNKK
jgi:hypothetical protein